MSGFDETEVPLQCHRLATAGVLGTSAYNQTDQMGKGIPASLGPIANAAAGIAPMTWYGTIFWPVKET